MYGRLFACVCLYACLCVSLYVPICLPEEKGLCDREMEKTKGQLGTPDLVLVLSASVIGSLRPSVVFGCKGILIIFGIFQAYETQRVRLKQVNDSRCCMLLVPQSHPSSANRKTRHLI
ncbi:hypothetical protein RRG08_030532 [Elysia crispata]|uniref:Secreted protein n=1 Tax=Elysia crispata TaxID=231223 RepID=A0AAE1D0X0_9GAST|nr:hypothetical protein RRG08_030532 [Elysia crispata]